LLALPAFLLNSYAPIIIALSVELPQCPANNTVSGVINAPPHTPANETIYSTVF
jgi:hypothetical protein